MYVSNTIVIDPVFAVVISGAKSATGGEYPVYVQTPLLIETPDDEEVRYPLEGTVFVVFPIVNFSLNLCVESNGVHFTLHAEPSVILLAEEIVAAPRVLAETALLVPYTLFDVFLART